MRRFTRPVAVALTCAGLGFAATPPADPPVRAWGQVTGTPPTALEAQLVPAAGGSPVVTAAARLTPTTGGLFYAADWPAAPVKAAQAAGLVLRFASNGGTPGTSTVPFVPGATPTLVHAVEGNPVLPAGRVLLAEARRSADTPPKIKFVAVFARSAGAVSGTVNWQGAGQAPVAAAALTAKVPGVTVHTQSVDTTAGTTPPALWSASFRSADAKEPWLHARTLLMELDQTVVDNLGTAGDLPNAPNLALTDKVYKLSTDSIPLEAGSYLALHLETDVSGESAVRSALTSWTLSAPPVGGTTAPLALPLSVCAVQPLPGGGSWVSGTWLCPKKVTLSSPALVGPPGGTLSGAWKVRSLTRFVLVGSKEEF